MNFMDPPTAKMSKVLIVVRPWHREIHSSWISVPCVVLKHPNNFFSVQSQNVRHYNFFTNGLRKFSVGENVFESPTERTFSRSVISVPLTFSPFLSHINELRRIVWMRVSIDESSYHGEFLKRKGHPVFEVPC